MSSERTRVALVFGAAGFIDPAQCQHLLECGDSVIGIDNLNSYYDSAFKRACLTEAKAVLKAASEGWSQACTAGKMTYFALLLVETY